MTPEEIAAKFAECENRIKVSEHRIKDLEETQKEIRSLTVSVHKMAFSLENMVAEQKEQGARLNVLEGEPAKKWNSVSETILTTLVGTIFGAIGAGILAIIAMGL